MPLIITGHSDDLIEIDGDWSEEFNAHDEGDFLAFSDGTVMRVKYDDGGVWRIKPVTIGLATVTAVQAPEDDEDNYSDRVTLDGESITWVMLGSCVARAKGPNLYAGER